MLKQLHTKRTYLELQQYNVRQSSTPAVHQSTEVDRTVPRYRLDSYGHRCFAVAGPSTWNSLPDIVRDPALSLSIFRRQLKIHFL